jgi:hypothetical protein
MLKQTFLLWRQRKPMLRPRALLTPKLLLMGPPKRQPMRLSLQPLMLRAMPQALQRHMLQVVMPGRRVTTQTKQYVS